MDMNIGDVTARLRAVDAGFSQAMQQANQQLTQLAQAVTQVQQSLAQMAQSQATTAQAVAQSSAGLRGLSEAIRDQTQAYTQTAAAALAYKQEQDKLREAIRQQREEQQQATAAARQAQDVWRTALGVAAGVGLATSLTAIVGLLKNVASESLSLAAKMQDLHRAFTSIEGSSGAANKTLSFLFDTANRLGVDFEKVTDGFKRFDQAAKGTTLGAETIRKVFENVLAGSRVLGSSTDQVSHLIIALEQMMTKGKLSAEEYQKQLGNALPGGLKFAADGFTLTTQTLKQMIESGLIPADAFVVALAKSLGALGGQDASGAVDGLSSTFNRLKNETTAWLTALGNGISGVISPFLEMILDISKALRDLFSIRPPGASSGKGLDLRNPAQGPSEFETPSTTRPVIPSPYDALIAREGARSPLPPDMFRRLIERESNFNPQATGPVTKSGESALGLGQIMPQTGADLGLKTFADFFDPEKNLAAAATYLGQLNKEITKDYGDLADKTKLVLAAYNAGIGNVQKAIEATKAAGETLTFEAVLARLPKKEETGPYVQFITGGRPQAPLGTKTLAQEAMERTPDQAAAVRADEAAGRVPRPGAGGELDPLATMLKTMDKTLEQIPLLKAQLESLSTSPLNFAGMLGGDLQKQTDALAKKFIETAELLARMPELAAKLTTEQREQLELAARDVAILQQKIKDEAQTDANVQKRLEPLREQLKLQEQLATPQRDVLKAQAEELEALTVKRRADLIALQQGRAAAEAFTREQTAAIQLRRAAEESDQRLLPQPLEQQIAKYTAQITILKAQAATLGAELETARAREQLPQLEATLGRLSTFLGRPTQSLPEQAQADVVQQGKALQAAITKALEEVQRDPALQQLAPMLAQQFAEGLASLPDAVVAKGQQAFAKMDEQMRLQIAKTGDELDQFSMKLSAAGLRPIEADLARIRREFEAMRAQLEQFRAKLLDLRPTATPERQGEIDTQVGQIDTLLPQVTPALDAALLERERRPAIAEIQRLQNQLGQLRVQQSERLGIKAEQRVNQVGMTEEDTLIASSLLKRIKEQQQLNYLMGLTESLASSVGSAWSSALLSIANGTATVAGAFKAMTQSILQSMAQLASQEAFKALFRLGFGALAGAFTSNTGQIDVGGTIGAEGAASPPPLLFAQGGAIVNKPTTILAGENPAMNPEYVVNHPQMQKLMGEAFRAAPSAGGQAAGESGITIVNVATRGQAEEEAGKARAQGRQAIINEVLGEMSKGESSRIVKMMRTTQR